jgi:asparagine synthase (glutamine-hydrolysing)
MGSLIAVLNKKGENTTPAATTMLKALATNSTAEAFGIASPINVKVEKTIADITDQNLKSPIIIGYIFSKTLSADKPQPTKLENATIIFEGRTYQRRTVTSDFEAIATKPQQNHTEIAKALIKKVEGDFAFVIAQREKLIAGRDPIGTRPLYYGETIQYAALASERKAFWKIGIPQTESFPPGHIAQINKNGFKFTNVKAISYKKPKPMTMQTATKRLQTLLKQSVKQRLKGLKEVAIAFSGGLDSSIIAYLAKETETNVHLIHVSLKDQPEVDKAKRAAESLGLPISVQTYTKENLQETLPKVLWLIEESDPVKTSIGIPFFWTAEQASKKGFKIMLAGQGADELFGGYRRYLDDYARYGEEFVQKTIVNDIAYLYEANLERDSKICSFHDVELRLPFATFELAKFAASLPLRQKLELSTDSLRKIVLRKAAKELGLPPQITSEPKKAIQYATGVNKALNKIARHEHLRLKEYLEKVFQTAFEEMIQNE